MEYQSGAVQPIENIKEGWNIIKDDYWTFFLMGLVAIVISIIAVLILSAVNSGITFAISTGLGLATQNAGDAGKISAAIIPQVISLVISIVMNIITTTLSGAFLCGIYSALARKVNIGTVEFGELFGGFRYLQPCLVVSLILSLLGFILGIIGLFGGLALGFSAVGMGVLTKNGQFDPAIFGALFGGILIFLVAAFLVQLVINVLTAFIYPLIAERNLSGFQALAASIKSGFGNFIGLTGLVLLLGLMAFGSLILCLVPFLFVAPILMAAIFAAYRSVFGNTSNYGSQSPPPPPIFGNQPGY